MDLVDKGAGGLLATDAEEPPGKVDGLSGQRVYIHSTAEVAGRVAIDGKKTVGELTASRSL